MRTGVYGDVAVTRDEILLKIRDVMMDVFDLDRLTISESTTAEDIEEWDSLSHLRLVAQVEAEFGVTFASSEVERLENVGDMVSSIEAKLRR
jgi:acyl carrier protein